jgi:hypothetical protein
LGSAGKRPPLVVFQVLYEDDSDVDSGATSPSTAAVSLVPSLRELAHAHRPHTAAARASKPDWAMTPREPAAAAAAAAATSGDGGQRATSATGVRRGSAASLVFKTRWVTLRARWVTRKSSLGDATSSLGDEKELAG